MTALSDGRPADVRRPRGRVARGRRATGPAALGVVASLAACLASPARAADRVYWANWVNVEVPGADTISYANLNGSGGGALSTAGATVNAPDGVTIDSATGRVYWTNFDAVRGAISFASLEGGGGDLNTAPVRSTSPDGVAIDPLAGRIYWADYTGNTISYANLDGSGAGELNTAGATMYQPAGVAIDAAAGTIYWANWSGVLGDKISFANLDGSGGGDLDTAGATVNNPEGVAIDAAAGRIYWANQATFGPSTISFANLDGSGGGDLNTAGATVNHPEGVAIDAAAGRIYWANSGASGGGAISYANLNGSGGGDLSTIGAPDGNARYPALLETPAPAGAPTISGTTSAPSTLFCTTGSWAPDLLGSFLYRAPQGLSYAWSLNGRAIAGATSSSYAASAGGNYLCTVTARNGAGTAAQTSGPHTLSGTPASKATITALAETNAIFTVGSASTPLTGRSATKRHPRGTVFSFRLDQPAIVTIAIRTNVRGRRVGNSCRPYLPGHRGEPRCTRTITVATLTRTSHAGVNRVAFTGRLHGRALTAGRYRAAFTAVDAAGSTSPRALGFTITPG